MNIEIQMASVDHIEAVVPLFDRYRQFYGQATALEKCRTFLMQRLHNKQSVIFIATVASKAAERQASGFVQLYPSFSSVRLKPLWILNDLFVDLPFRRLGVASELLAKAEARAAESGSAGLVLQTAVTNSSAQRLYESRGWVRDTEYYSYFLNV